MTDPAARPAGLAEWLGWLRIEDCPCAYGWRSIGVLYGVSMGEGWVRLTTAPGCPHHDADQEGRRG